MMVLNDKCKVCDYICNAMHFQHNFVNWTSDNDNIDKFIKDTQLSVHNNASKALEWIPYDRFYDIKCITEESFGKVYRAIWIDGHIDKWDVKSQSWNRYNKNMSVALKSLNSSKNITLEFLNEVKFCKIKFLLILYFNLHFNFFIDYIT